MLFGVIWCYLCFCVFPQSRAVVIAISWNQCTVFRLWGNATTPSHQGHCNKPFSNGTGFYFFVRGPLGVRPIASQAKPRTFWRHAILETTLEFGLVGDHQIPTIQHESQRPSNRLPPMAGAPRREIVANEVVDCRRCLMSALCCVSSPSIFAAEASLCNRTFIPIKRMWRRVWS